MFVTPLRSLFLLLSGAAAVILSAYSCSDGAPQCLGDAVACENRSAEECAGGGCSIREGCLGGELTCDSVEGLTLCNQTPGCRWVGQCDGSDACRALSYNECGNAPGCVQVRRCYGDGTRCEDLEASLCELYPQCENRSSCTGNATDCIELEADGQCSGTPGCFIADTTPIVAE